MLAARDKMLAAVQLEAQALKQELEHASAKHATEHQHQSQVCLRAREFVLAQHRSPQAAQISLVPLCWSRMAAGS
jgi:hypothetical protein